MEMLKQKILFLDRDGTICYDEGAFGSERYPYEEVLEKTRPIEGVKESLRYAKEKGYLLVVISNQAGIAKGSFDEWHTHYCNMLLQDKLDGLIDGFYYCPHHTTGKNNKGKIAPNAKLNLICECNCRKPMIGMFLKCEEDLKNGKLQYIDKGFIDRKLVYEEDRDKIYKKNVEKCQVDKSNSYMIGDKWIDVLAGERYGVNPIFVLTGEGEVEYYKKKETQKILPINYKVYKDINTFIRECI